jgi:hypothetical protein
VRLVLHNGVIIRDERDSSALLSATLSGLSYFTPAEMPENLTKLNPELQVVKDRQNWFHQR